MTTEATEPLPLSLFFATSLIITGASIGGPTCAVVLAGSTDELVAAPPPDTLEPTAAMIDSRGIAGPQLFPAEPDANVLGSIKISNFATLPVTTRTLHAGVNIASPTGVTLTR